METLLITEHRGRISPVFDTATVVCVAQIEPGAPLRLHRQQLFSFNPAGRAEEFCRLGSGKILCGAISRPFRESLLYHNFEVIDFLCGEVEAIATAFAKNAFDISEFSMPGCQGRLGAPSRRRQRNRCGCSRNTETLDATVFINHKKGRR
jgi:hypothetical protein